MQRFIIERAIPGASKISADEMAAISAKSLGVLRELGPDVQWVESFVTADKLYCVYLAKNVELVREHARRGGFPADAVNVVTRMIDPTTAASR